MAISLLLLAAIILIHEFTRVDFVVQSWIYQDGWPLPRKDKILRLIFHEVPKWTLIACASVMLVLHVTARFTQKLPFFKSKKILFMVLSLSVVPIIAGTAKHYSHTYCPYELQDFGGTNVYRPFFESYVINAGGHCYPAGHAAVGFGLLGLILLARTRSEQIAFALATLSFGWVLGGYQMLNGNHFLTHTLSSMVLAWIEILCIYRFLFNSSRHQSII